MLDTPSSSLQPRAKGELVLSSKTRGDHSVINDLRQSGCLRMLFPVGGKSLDAVMINTSGGVTGGDRISTAAVAGVGSAITLTTQAAERAYRAQPDQTGRISNRLRVERNAVLNWLPQELILFDGSRLSRDLHVDTSANSRALLIEPVVFGRTAMGEALTDITFRDRISVNRDGKPVYRDGVDMRGNAVAQLAKPAIGRGMLAMASVIYAAPDAEVHLPNVRKMLPKTGGVSLLSDSLLVGRIMAQDSYLLRQALIPVLELLSGAQVPKTWRL